jgi:hypothetical protein
MHYGGTVITMIPVTCSFIIEQIRLGFVSFILLLYRYVVVCVCNGNYDGVACDACIDGFTGDDCTTPSRLCTLITPVLCLYSCHVV